MLTGAQLEGGGVSLSYDVFNRNLNVTPIMIFNSNGIFKGWGLPLCELYCGLTVGGTVVYENSTTQEVNNLVSYELGHITGFDKYGTEYLLRILTDACKYDPRASWAWADCGTARTINHRESLPTTGSFTISFR